MVGRTISHYKILEQLGQGGMGVVYKAEDTKLRRLVALKFLSPAFLGGGEERERFLREAQAAASLDHPNICTVYEIDEAEGQTFLSMAYIDGQPLQKRIAAGPLKMPEIIDIAQQTAEGLQAAHRREIVHRDIKPANLMITEESANRRRVKIMDFGLAQLLGRSRITKLDSALGTAAYMSPEQSQGAKTIRSTSLPGKSKSCSKKGYRIQRCQSISTMTGIGMCWQLSG
jgi:serine/threonine protein kinase